MRRESGFLLLEVILSVLLVAGGLLVVTMSFSVSKQLMLRSREAFRAALLLRERMFAYEEKGSIETGERSGGWPNERWSWRMRSEPLGVPAIQKVTVTVGRTDRTMEGHTLIAYLPEKIKE